MNPEDARRTIISQRLYRRRLSAPETLMRKHLLAKEQSSRQTSKENGNHWTTRQVGSDPNLNHNFRKHSDIRKSTLIRQFWENSKGNINIPNSYSEWQYLFGSKSRKCSTPELRSSFHGSPVRRRRSPQLTSASKSEDESHFVDSFTRSDFSDSNSLSTETTTDRLNNNAKEMEQGPHQSSDTAPIKYQFVVNGNQNEYQFVQPESTGNSEGIGRTNLNVITNVQLSASTLNLIFSQVMQDVLQKAPEKQEVTKDKLVTQKAYNFQFNIDEHVPVTRGGETSSHISEVNAGSPYRNKNPSTVPRFSALPKTSSMEVNISSTESFEKDSDNSLVDSLDDPCSPKFAMKKKNVITEKTETRSFVQSNKQTSNGLENVQKTTTIRKSSVFYIPINEDAADFAKTDNQGVSATLPMKLKERLHKRQMKREEKRLQERMKSFDAENRNGYFSTSPEISSKVHNHGNKSHQNDHHTSNAKIKCRTTLPQIDLKKDYDKSFRSFYTQRSLNKYREYVDSTSKQNKSSSKSFWAPKSRGSCSSKSETKCESSHNKHIEILEIMEIVDPIRNVRVHPKTKSRIPVLQQGTPTKLPILKTRPTFLDVDALEIGDPKLDQLIANILIDTLNHEEVRNIHKMPAMHLQPPHPRTGSNSQNTTTCRTPANSPEANNNPNLLTQHVLNNNEAKEPFNLTETQDNMQLDEIPKGWITLYMLQKNTSPDSTSDEGRTNVVRNSTQYVGSGKDAHLRCENIHQTIYSDTTGTGIQRVLNKRKTQKMPHGWSVTLTSNDNEYPPPEIEMKFKFPEVPQTVLNKKCKNIKNPYGSTKEVHFETVCKNEKSEIEKSKQFLKFAQCATNVKYNMDTLTPRATKTSRQRTLLNHQHHLQVKVSKNPLASIQTPISEPNLLAISGNTFNQLRCLPKISEQDFQMLISNLKQQRDIQG